MVSTKTEHYLRLLLLIVNVATPILLKTFLKFVNNSTNKNVDTFLKVYENDFKALKRKRILKDTELKKLFPTNGKTVVDEWDISLLCLVISHCCTLNGKLYQLKDMLLQESRFDINTFININKSTISSMKGNEINKYEYEIVFPDNNAATEFEKWNMNLVIQILFKLFPKMIANVNKILREICIKEIDLKFSNVNINKFLNFHSSTLSDIKDKGIISEAQFDELFPDIGSDINKWDDHTLRIVLLNTTSYLSKETMDALRTLRTIRSEFLAHRGDAKIEFTDFSGKCRELTDAVMKILKEEELPTSEFEQSINDIVDGPLEVQSSLDCLKAYYAKESLENDKIVEVLDKVCDLNQKVCESVESVSQKVEAGFGRMDSKFDAILKHFDNTERKLPEFAYTEKAEIRCIDMIIVIQSETVEKKDKAESIIINAMQQAEQNTTAQIQAAFDVIRKIVTADGKTIVTIERGSVILGIKCISLKGLHQLLKYAGSERMQSHLTEAATALSAFLEEVIHLTVHVSLTSLIDACEDSVRCLTYYIDHTSHLKMTILRPTVQELQNVVREFRVGEGASQLRVLSSELSDYLGEKISIDTVTSKEILKDQIHEELCDTMVEKNDHFYRLVTFTVEGCPQPMWELFEKKAKLDTRPGTPFTDLDSYLAFHQPLAQQMLNTRKLNINQINLIYPTGSRVDITKWDVTLASTMLQNFFKPLPANEQSLINDIRQVRNDLQHISGSAEVDERTFRQYWTTLRQSALGLASLVSTDCHNSTNEYINELHFKPLPAPGGVLEILKEWYFHDKHLERDMKSTLDAAKGGKQILNDIIVRSTNRTGAVSKRMKVTDTVLENMKASMANTFKQTDLTDFDPPSEISRIRSELRDQHRVVVAGYGNSKHLETCLYAIKDMDYTLERCVQVTGSEECHHICCEDVDLVLFVDPFGKFNYDAQKAKGLSDYMDRIIKLTKLSDDEGRIDLILSTNQTVLDTFKEEHEHELLENVVTINKPTTEKEPHFINDCKKRRHAETKGNIPTAIQEQSTIYIAHLQQRYKEHEKFEAAKRMFQHHKAIVLIGPPASRSDILAANLMTAYQSDQCVVLNRPSDWRHIKLSEVSVILITEFTGKFKFDESLSTKWLTQFDIILAAVREGKLNVIITSHQEFLDRCLKEISNHELLQHVLPLTAPYTAEQKVKIEPGTSTDDNADQNDLEEVLPVDHHHDEQPVQLVGRYTIQLKDGSTRLGIEQLCPVSRDVFLMSTCWSSCLYRLDSSYQEIDHLNMDGNVGHIVSMNDHEAAVNPFSVPSHTIHVVSLADKMQVVNKITTTVRIETFDFQTDKFFICSFSDNTIHVYTVSGSPLHTIPYNVGNDELNKSLLFNKIAVRDNRIAIGCYSSKDDYTCIVCLNMNGDQLRTTYSSTRVLKLRNLPSLIIDENNNVIVSDGKQIIKASQCGQYQSVLIDLDQFGFTNATLSIYRPLSRLYVTDVGKEDVIVYDYTCK